MAGHRGVHPRRKGAMSRSTLDGTESIDRLADAVDGTTSVGLDLNSLRAMVREGDLARIRGWRNLAHMVLELGLYVGLAALGRSIDERWAWVPIWIAMGFLFLACGGIIHETVHGHLYRAKWANKLAGTLAGMVMLFPWGTYRSFHIEHHASTTTENDPEGIPIAFGSRLEFLMMPLGGLYTLAQLNWYTARSLLGHPPRWVRTRGQRRDVRRSAVAVAAFAALVVVAFAASPSLVVDVWLVPVLVAMFVAYPLIFLPEHAWGEPGPTLTHTRTTTSNQLLCWIYWNNNYHAVHHLIPTVVHQHIPALSQYLRPYQTGDWWNDGYLTFTWSRFRSVPTLPSRRRPTAGRDGIVIDLRGGPDQAKATSSTSSREK
jgi:fatty acid desaturase